MKKLVLAAAIAAIAGNAMAAEVYSNDDASFSIFGEIRTDFRKSTDKSANNTGKQYNNAKTFNMNSSKLGVKGNFKLNEMFTAKAYTRFKYDGTTSNGKAFRVDKSWIGLDAGQYGEVRVGRVGSIYDDIMWSHDASKELGGRAIWTIGGAAYGTDVQDSMLSYTWKNDSFTVYAQTQIAPVNAASKVGGVSGNVPTDTVIYGEYAIGSIDENSSIGAEWVSDFGLSVAAAYATAEQSMNATPATATYKNDRSETNTAGLSVTYNIKGFTVSVLKTASELETNVVAATGGTGELKTLEKDGTGFGVAYKFDNGVNPYFVFDQVETTSKLNNGNKVADNTEQTVVIGVKKSFSRNLMAFAEAANVKSDGYQVSPTVAGTAVKLKSYNKWAIGARVYF